MKAIIKKTVEITLILTTKEAHWLKAKVKNEYGPNESNEDREIRNKIFNAIPPFSELT